MGEGEGRTGSVERGVFLFFNSGIHGCSAGESGS